MSRVAVVTGAASGIGFSCARHLSEAGHRVAMLDLKSEIVDTAAELGVVGRVVDVGDRACVDEALDAVREALGPIEIMVTSAGIDGARPLTDITLDEWDRTIRVNLTGTFHCVQAAVPDMVDAGWGRIVTISSSSAQSGAPDRAHYVASKGGVIAFTKACAVDLAAKGITANTIPPSVIDTPMARAGEKSGSIPADLDTVARMSPVKRLGQPEDVGAACVFLCSEEAGYITGQQINVNGGWYM